MQVAVKLDDKRLCMGCPFNYSKVTVKCRAGFTRHKAVLAEIPDPTPVEELGPYQEVAMKLAGIDPHKRMVLAVMPMRPIECVMATEVNAVEETLGKIDVASQTAILDALEQKEPNAKAP
jgi:hypothetical protein